jgi:RND family efflux transporter MFP subunit
MIFKFTKMNTISKLAAVAFITIAAVACGSSAKENKGSANDKKVELQKLKDQQADINKRIRAIEEELAKTDTGAAAKAAKLVAITPIESQQFAHYIDLQGRVESENIVYVTPRGTGGQVNAIYVKQGDDVRKGQLLMKLDNAIAEQQIAQLKVQLELAETLYDRRKNLWDKQIGTEVELLQAKTNVDNLKKQLALLNEQAGMSNIYAPISGVADMVTIKVGEFFTAAAANMVGIRIVNKSDLKVVTQVPENYLHRVKEGAEIEITLPDLNKTVRSRISVKGPTIDPSSRSFYIEAKIPSSKDFQPNQIALVRIQDYAASDAITIPMNTLQNDEKGKFVMVAVNENGKLIARKRPLEIGMLYGNNLEVKAGLQPNDALITEGFQGLYEGQQITTKQSS